MILVHLLLLCLDLYFLGAAHGQNDPLLLRLNEVNAKSSDVFGRGEYVELRTLKAPITHRSMQGYYLSEFIFYTSTSK